MSDTDFSKRLRKFADLLVHVGVNVQPDQEVYLRVPVEATELARALNRSAYDAGARLVHTIYLDEALTRIRFNHAPRDSFDAYPTWLTRSLAEGARNGDAMISVLGSDPELLKGQDPKLLATYQQAISKGSDAFRREIMKPSCPWTLGALPVPSWAKKVFPDLDADSAVKKLWDLIFKVCRVDEDDPVQAWEDHLAGLSKYTGYMNNKAYKALKYSGPGTDLTIGLPEDHLWCSGREKSLNDIVFTANIPTEEIWSLPDRNRVDGTVSSSKPLNHMGQLIEDFSFTFKDGKVVDFKAREGEDALRSLLETDEGASHIGEVALVPHSSPISQSGVLFYNTLFDENAACHIALGAAYRMNMKNSANMSEDEFKDRGGNASNIHVDFMIGNDQLDIDGILPDGTSEPVMRSGEWAFTL